MSTAASHLRRSGRADPLALAALLAMVALAVPGPARAVVVLPLALLAPGWYVLPKQAREEHDLVRLACLSAALSFAVEALLGLALGVSPLGANRTSMTAATATFIAVAGVLRRGSCLQVPRRLTGGDVAVVVLACTYMAAVIAVGVKDNAGRATPSSFSSLSLAGPSARISGPVPVKAGGRFSVDVSVSNHTGGPLTYLLAAKLDGEATSTEVAVAPGRSWSGPLTVRVPATGCLERLTVSADPVDGAGGGPVLGLWLRWPGCGAAAP